MAQARFLWDNFAFASTTVVNASTALANRPAAYAVNPQRTRRWRSSTTTNDEWLSLDFGALKTFDSIGLVDWAANGRQVQAQTSLDGLSWSNLGTAIAQLLPNQTRAIYRITPSSPVSSRYVRVLFQYPGGGGSYAQIGIVVVALAYVPTFDLAETPTVRRQDPSLISSSIGRQEYGHTREKYFEVMGRFPSLPDTDRDLYQAMFEAVGTERPFLFSYDYQTLEHTYWGRLTVPYDRAHQLGMYHDIPFGFMEVL